MKPTNEQPPKPSEAVRRFNDVVERFDNQTAFLYDRAPLPLVLSVMGFHTVSIADLEAITAMLIKPTQPLTQD